MFFCLVHRANFYHELGHRTILRTGRSMLKTTEDGDFPLRFVRNATSGLKLKVKLIAHSCSILSFQVRYPTLNVVSFTVKRERWAVTRSPYFFSKPMFDYFHAP